MVMNDDEFETKEHKIWTKDKIEPYHIFMESIMRICQIKQTNINMV